MVILGKIVEENFQKAKNLQSPCQKIFGLTNFVTFRQLQACNYANHTTELALITNKSIYF